MNSGLPRTKSASGQNGIWTRDLRISNPALLPLGHTATKLRSYFKYEFKSVEFYATYCWHKICLHSRTFSRKRACHLKKTVAETCLRNVSAIVCRPQHQRYVSLFNNSITSFAQRNTCNLLVFQLSQPASYFSSMRLPFEHSNTWKNHFYRSDFFDETDLFCPFQFIKRR